jgi:hypothetical protein
VVDLQPGGVLQRLGQQLRAAEREGGERDPLIELGPVASWRSCFLVRPWRLSSPVMSQFVPAEATGRPG